MRARLVFGVCCAVVLMAATVHAQPAAGYQAPLTRFGLDSVTSAETYVEHDGAEAGAAIDLLGGWQAGPVQILARPVLRRNHDGDWSADVYQLAVRHDRGRRVRMRLEAGYLPSPIGISPLETRASDNPLVAPITSYTTRLPLFEEGTPRTQLASPLYPLAVQATWSTPRWDLRTSVLESSLVRVRPLTGEYKPPRAPQLAVGGGITPRTGLRLGASAAFGRYARADEVAGGLGGDRHARILSVDGDYSVAYTRVYGDFVHTRLDRAEGYTTATALTVTAVQTLTPRWYVAARGQRLTTSHLLASGYESPHDQPYHHRHSEEDYALAALGGYIPGPDDAPHDLGPSDALTIETGVGFRLSPDLTVRASYLGYRAFVGRELEHHAVFSLVWTRRWF